MRSFLEAVLKEYLVSKKEPATPRQQGGFVYLDDVLKKAQSYFKSKSNHQMRQIVTELIKHKESFDCINHNPSIFSTEEKVKIAADQMSDLIKFIFEDSKL